MHTFIKKNLEKFRKKSKKYFNVCVVDNVVFYITYLNTN